MLIAHKTVYVILAFAAVGCFLGGLGSLAASFRHRLPDISWAWVFRSFLSRHNFTERGRKLRARGWRLLLLSILAFGLTNLYRNRVSHWPPLPHKKEVKKVDDDIGE